MQNRIAKAFSRLSSTITNDIIDILTMILAALVHIVKHSAIWMESKTLELRTKRGYDVFQFEKKLEDWQIEKMAIQLKMTIWERDRLDRLGETVVLSAENWPNLSRRQARKVLETYKILRKNTAFGTRRVR